MKKTVDSIKLKWDVKLIEMKKAKDQQTHYQIEKEREKLYHEKETEFEKKRTKLLKKAEAYKKRKETEYKRKCMNEIRAFQGKELKTYKQKPLKNTQKTQIALAILQENCRLRDTNADGYGYCISCGKRCSWEELAGGHRQTRKLISVCLRPENVNAQCHNCNYTTGPKGNVVEKERVNARYRDNIIKKYGDQIVAEIEERVREEIRNPHKYRIMGPYLDELVPELIKENKRLWAQKSPDFRENHKPGKNRQKVYEKYRNLSNNGL